MIITGPSHATAEVPQVSINLDDVESGQLLLRSENALSSAILLSTDVKINIAGTISRTVVSQRFINTGETWAEGVYVFPIGETAAVDTLKMRIGDRFIEGIMWQIIRLQKGQNVIKMAWIAQTHDLAKLKRIHPEGRRCQIISQPDPFQSAVIHRLIIHQRMGARQVTCHIRAEAMEVPTLVMTQSVRARGVKLIPCTLAS